MNDFIKVSGEVFSLLQQIVDTLLHYNEFNFLVYNTNYNKFTILILKLEEMNKNKSFENGF